MMYVTSNKETLIMFKKMRRSRQQLPMTECEEILALASSGVLAVSGDDDYPYAVPLSYVYHDGKIFFHCAKEGHKIDAIRRNPKASFCVIYQDDVVPEKYTTYFKSVIVFGRARILDKDEILPAITLLAKKYYPSDSEENRSYYIEKEFDALCMIELDAEHISGKECIELTRKRENA